MVQKSGEHKLRLVVHPIIYDGFQHHLRWFSRRISEPSTVLSMHPGCILSQPRPLVIFSCETWQPQVKMNNES